MIEEVRMLQPRCEKVFAQFLGGSDLDATPEAIDRLRSAFARGTEAAKRGTNLGVCPFSSTSSPDEFLAWVSGFHCCQRR